jgi:hypothetical protein
MPDLDLIKQGEQGVRDRCGRFAGGRSGNPAGRPRGCRDHVREHAVEFTMPPIGNAVRSPATSVSLRAKRSNLGLLSPHPVGIASSRDALLAMTPSRFALTRRHTGPTEFGRYGCSGAVACGDFASSRPRPPRRKSRLYLTRRYSCLD